MPKQRLQVDSGVNPVGLSAPSAPVDAFERPVDPAATAAGQLASALSKLAPSLLGFSNTLQEKSNATQEAAGRAEAARLHQEGLDYAKEVKAGRLKLNDNPFFQAGLQEVQGSNAADQFNTDMMMAMGANESLKTSTDINEYRQFATQFASQWREQHRTDSASARFLAGFSSKSTAWMANNERIWASQANGRATMQAHQAIFGQLKTHTLTELGRGTPVAKIVADFESSFQFWSNLGVNGRAIKQAQFDAVVSAAQELSQSQDIHQVRMAMQALDLLRTIPGGPKGTLSLSAQDWAQEGFLNALGSVSTQVNQAERTESQRIAAVKDQAGDDILSAAANALTNDRYTPRSQFVLAMAAQDPGKLGALNGLFDGANENWTSNRALKDSLARRIFGPNPPTKLEIAQSVRNGGITFSDMVQLNAQLENATSGAGKAIQNEDALVDALKDLPSIFTITLGNGSIWANGETISNVRADMTAQFIAWRQGAGKDADELTKIEWLHNLLQSEIARDRQRNPAAGVTNPTPAVLTPGATKPSGEIVAPVWENTVILSAPQFALLQAPQRDSTGRVTMSPELQQIINQYNLNTPSKLRAFILAQKRLLLQSANSPATP